MVTLKVELPASRSGSHGSRARIRVRWSVSSAVYFVTGAWAAGFSIAAAVAQHLFLERRYDLGNFTQAIWSTAHGQFLQVTEVGGAEVSRLGIHVDPIIVALVPLWRIWPSPVMLETVQAVALAAGAIPLYWFARDRLQSETSGALIAGGYLLAPAIGWNAFHEFHAVALATPLLLFCIWALDNERMVLFAAAALLAIACQEQIGLVVGFLGLWYGWEHRRWVRGSVIAVSGIVISALEVGVLIPHFSGGSPYSGRYASVGGSPGGIVREAFIHPLHVLAAVVQPSDILGVGLLVLPVVGLCFRSRLMWAAFPQLALVLLSDRPNDLDFSAQTVLPIIPFIYGAVVLALAKPGVARRYTSKHVFVASVGVALTLGPFLPFGKHVPASSYVAAERHAVSLVPAGVAVSTTNHLGAHLASRRELYVFPIIKDAQWVLVDSTDPYMPSLRYLRRRTGIAVGNHDLYPQPRLMKRELRRLVSSREWTRVFASHGLLVFKRKPATAVR